MNQGEYLWNMCFLLGKKKGKRRNKIIKINLFKIGEQKMKEDTKMSLLVFFFFFLKPEIDS